MFISFHYFKNSTVEGKHCFINGRQAFDSVNRIKLFDAMNKLGLREKLIKPTKMTRAKLSAGSKQGDGLSEALLQFCLLYTSRCV